MWIKGAKDTGETFELVAKKDNRPTDKQYKT